MEPIEQTLEQKVEARIQAGIKIDFGLIFSDGWRIFKQIFWMVMIATIMIAVINWILSTVISLALPTPMDFDPSMFKNVNDPDEIMDMYKEIFKQVVKVQSSPIAQIRTIIISSITVLIMAPLQAGYMRNCREADKNKASFGDLFSYYKNEFTGRLVGTGLILTLASGLITFLVSFIPGAGIFISLILTLLSYLLFIYATPLIIFENATIKQALLLSMKLALNRIFPIIGFMLLCYILSLSGFILCCVGVFLTMAYLPIGNYLLYKCSMGFEDDELEQQPEAGHWQQQPPTE